MKKPLDFVLVAGAIAILLFADFQRFIDPPLTTTWIGIVLSLFIVNNLKNPRTKKPFLLFLLTMTLGTLVFINWTPLNFELIIHIVFALSPLVPIIKILTDQKKDTAAESSQSMRAGEPV